MKRKPRLRNKFRILSLILLVLFAIPVVTSLSILIFPKPLSFSPLFQHFLSLKNSEALFYACFSKMQEVAEVDPKRLYRLRSGLRQSFRMTCGEGIISEIPICTDTRGNRIRCETVPDDQIAENDEIDPDTYTILAIGDSNTFGWCLHSEESWPSLLEDYLNERSYRRNRVINAGVFGYTSFQCLETLREALGKSSDSFHLVLFWAGRNDQNRALQRTDAEWSKWLGTRNGQAALVRTESIFYRFLYLNRLLVLGLAEFVLPDRDDFSAKVSEYEFNQNLQTATTLLEKLGIPICFLSYESNEGYAVRRDVLQNRAEIIHPFEELRKEKNSSQSFNSESWFLIPNDKHLNTRGSNALARILADYIVASDSSLINRQ
ncbi:SGNH/GDSL hydrolase family protein [Thermodesulfobacteriota bacterium]